MAFNPEDVSKATYEELLAFLRANGAGGPSEPVAVRRNSLVSDAEPHAASSAKLNAAQNLNQSRSLNIPRLRSLDTGKPKTAKPFEPAAIKKETNNEIEDGRKKVSLTHAARTADDRANGNRRLSVNGNVTRDLDRNEGRRISDAPSRDQRATDDRFSISRRTSVDDFSRDFDNMEAHRMLERQGKRLVTDIKDLFDQTQSQASTEMQRLTEQLEQRMAQVQGIQNQCRQSMERVKAAEGALMQVTQRLMAEWKNNCAISESLFDEYTKMMDLVRDRSSMLRITPLNETLRNGVVTQVEKAFDGNDRDGRGRSRDGGRDIDHLGRRSRSPRRRSRSISSNRASRSGARTSSRTRRHSRSRSPRRNVRRSSRSPARARERERVPVKWNSYRPE
ncbi:hypothetical protein BC829DRAFT_385506 [Chytridium lagenaria]|nr:hypothetical protein BC829DRAFT_385506 [Chytridium lagenaria]